MEGGGTSEAQIAACARKKGGGGSKDEGAEGGVERVGEEGGGIGRRGAGVRGTGRGGGECRWRGGGGGRERRRRRRVRDGRGPERMYRFLLPPTLPERYSSHPPPKRIIRVIIRSRSRTK